MGFPNLAFAELWGSGLIGDSFYNDPPTAKVSDISFRILRVNVRNRDNQLVMRILLDRDSPKPPSLLLLPTLTVFNDRKIQFECSRLEEGPNKFIEVCKNVFQPGIDNFPKLINLDRNLNR